MSTLIVTGGKMDARAMGDYLSARRFEHVIAVDAGIFAVERLGLTADYLVGDFDTLGEAELKKRENTAGLSVRRYNPKKDDTDTEIAVSLAIELERGGATLREAVPTQKKDVPENGAFVGQTGITNAAVFFPEKVVLIGATGTRLDHTLANLFLLARFEAAGIAACIVDANNRISVHHAGFCFSKEEQYGKYISFLSLTPQVEGLTLRGFAYPLEGHALKQESSLCISNEAVEEKLCVEFEKGRLLMVESVD